MTRTQRLEIKIKDHDLRDSSEYSCIPRERLLASKIERAIKQYSAEGWRVENLRFDNDCTTIAFHKQS